MSSALVRLLIAGLVGGAAALTGVANAAPPPAPAAPAADQAIASAPEQAAVVTLRVPDRAGLDRLIAAGTDLTTRVREANGGIEIDAVVTPTELTALRASGFAVVDTIQSAAASRQRTAERDATVRAEQQALAAVDSVTIRRAVWFPSGTQNFLSVEAFTDAGASPDVTLTATWTTADGGTASAELPRNVDAGVYRGHWFVTPVPATARPVNVTVTSSQGGSASAPVASWPDGKPMPPTSPKYQKDFVTHYMAPDELYDRIERLHRQFPKLTSLITLPNRTNGYRRHAQAVFGTTEATSVVVTSKSYGSEGGNRVSVTLVNPTKANRPLSVSQRGSRVTVWLATDAAGSVTSTAAQVVAALNADAKRVLSATTYRGNAGAGVVVPAARTNLTDDLDAPASVSRKPYRVQALRIGVHRDGSKTGVLAYAQEHAREWVTPLVTVEGAERLLRNYAKDPATRRLLRETDIFILPSTNPDGANYSFYDANMQRKNLTNHCPADTSDPARRDQWGVDVNRNYRVGSLFDGYFGASASCTSGTFAGPSENSEPESRNVGWLADRHPNIKFSMNVHSYGGYFMWSPGAYQLAGRVTLPRPTAGEEAFFEESARQIEQAIAAERGTVTWPQYTGPVADVLYSAAGNSADQLWYENHIFAWNFEVGNDRWNPTTREWEGVGFQPPFEEGHEEAMEYASGLIALIQVAADYE